MSFRTDRIYYLLNANKPANSGVYVGSQSNAIPARVHVLFRRGTTLMAA
jgi:hypothetical protein